MFFTWGQFLWFLSYLYICICFLHVVVSMSIVIIIWSYAGSQITSVAAVRQEQTMVRTVTQHLRVEFFRFLRRRHSVRCRAARRCASLTCPAFLAHHVARLRERTVHIVTGRDICHLHSLFLQHIVRALPPGALLVHTPPVPQRSPDLIIAFSCVCKFEWLIG